MEGLVPFLAIYIVASKVDGHQFGMEDFNTSTKLKLMEDSLVGGFNPSEKY